MKYGNIENLTREEPASTIKPTIFDTIAECFYIIVLKKCFTIRYNILIFRI